MDQSSRFTSHIPKVTRRIASLDTPYSKYSSAKHFEDHFEEQTDPSIFNLNYTLNDAKNHLNQSVYYLKNNISKSWFKSKQFFYIVAILFVLFAVTGYFSLRFEIKALKGTITSTSQDKNLLENKLERLEKQFKKLTGIKLESKPVDDQQVILDLRNEIEQSIIDKLDEKIEKIIEQELDSRLPVIKSKTEDFLRSELSESLAYKLDSMFDEKLKDPRNLIALDENSLNYSIKAAIDNLVLDKDSKLDYASELNNAIILEASPTYIDPDAYSIFSIPLWTSSKPPNYLLKRNRNLLNLSPKPWKMNSNSGFVSIKLAKPIIPKSFAYEHVLKNSILDENQFTCSPKVFRVSGYEPDKEEPIALGKFNFELSFDNFQTEFEFDKKLETEISVIKFTIEDNYGNSNYTCLHRLKVF